MEQKKKLGLTRHRDLADEGTLGTGTNIEPGAELNHPKGLDEPNSTPAALSKKLE